MVIRAPDGANKSSDKMHLHFCSICIIDFKSQKRLDKETIIGAN